MGMGVGIGLWVTKWVVSNAAKAALERTLSSSLQKEIDKLIVAWAAGLPPEAKVAPASLNLDPARASGGLANLPALEQLGVCFAEGQIPRRRLWFAALVEQRHEIKRIFDSEGTEPELFFELGDAEANPLLDDLARQIDLKCREQESLFRTHTSSKVDDILDQLGGLTAVLKLVADDVNDEITDAFEFTKSGKPSVTVTQLTGL